MMDNMLGGDSCDDDENEEFDCEVGPFLSSNAPSQPSILLKSFLLCVTLFGLVAVVFPFFLLERSSTGDGTTREEMLVWHEIQELVCPNQTPQSIKEKIGPFLFYKAQQVLGTNMSNCAVTENHWKNYMSSVWEEDYDAVWETVLEHGSQDDGVGMGNGDGTNDMRESRSGQHIIYIPIWKCSHETIRKWWSDLAEPPNNLTNRKWTPTEMKENLQKLPQNKTCMVTLIRDPISHFLSGYNEMAVRAHERNPSFMPSMDCNEVPFHHIDNLEDRFKTFVHQYVQGMLRGNFEDRHVHPMMRVLALFEADGYPTDQVHYLPQMTNLSHDWPAFVDDTCSKHFNGNYDYNFSRTTSGSVISKAHESSFDLLGTHASAKKVFYEDQGPVAKALCFLRMPDYACWRNLPDGVPPLCMQVYTDPYFRRELDTILKEPLFEPGQLVNSTQIP